MMRCCPLSREAVVSSTELGVEVVVVGVEEGAEVRSVVVKGDPMLFELLSRGRHTKGGFVIGKDCRGE